MHKVLNIHQKKTHGTLKAIKIMYNRVIEKEQKTNTQMKWEPCEVD